MTNIYDNLNLPPRQRCTPKRKRASTKKEKTIHSRSLDDDDGDLMIHHRQHCAQYERINTGSHAAFCHCPFETAALLAFFDDVPQISTLFSHLNYQ